MADFEEFGLGTIRDLNLRYETVEYVPHTPMAGRNTARRPRREARLRLSPLLRKGVIDSLVLLTGNPSTDSWTFWA